MLKNPIRNGLLIALAIFIADQAVKWWMLDILMIADRGPISVTPFFSLVMVWNRGISFGMLNALPHTHLLFSGLAIVISSLLVLWLKKADHPWLVVGLGLIIGGAVGNMIDRLRFGAVADFFYFHVAEFYWPAFNIADAAICIGAGLIILESLVHKKHEKTT